LEETWTLLEPGLRGDAAGSDRGRRRRSK